MCRLLVRIVYFFIVRTYAGNVTKTRRTIELKENIKIYENRVLSVIRVSIELTTKGRKKVQIKNDEQ